MARCKATSGKRPTPASCPSMDINVARAMVLSSSVLTTTAEQLVMVTTLQCSATTKAADSFEQSMKKGFTFKRLEVLGFQEGDDEHATFPTRVLTVDTKSQPWRLVCEPDSRHAKRFIRELGWRRRRVPHRSADRQLMETKSERLNAELKHVQCVQLFWPRMTQRFLRQ